jgi:nucleoside-diphosphate-sugar epimerase
MLAVKNPAKKGRPQVWNQLSEWHSMNEIANMVIKTADKCGIKRVEWLRIPTPRKEHTGKHYYNYITKNLTDLGYKTTRTIEQEVEYVLNLIPKWSPEQKEILKNLVTPKVKWV